MAERDCCDDEEDLEFPLHLPDRCPMCFGEGYMRYSIAGGGPYAEEPPSIWDVCDRCGGTGEPACEVCRRQRATGLHVTESLDLVLCCDGCMPEALRNFLEEMRAARQQDQAALGGASDDIAGDPLPF